MRKLRFIIPVVLALFFFGCTTGAKPWDKRSSEEKELFFKQIYNSQYEDTIALGVKPDLTEQERELVRFKKKLLSEARTAIDLYTLYTAQGEPTEELEAKILELLDRLLSKILEEG